MQRRALWAALAINLTFVLAEFGGGIAFHSLALLADSAHQLTDVVALALALVALRLVEWPGSARHTFGLQRAEVLVALANGAILGAAAMWVGVEAVRRFDHPGTISAPGVIVVALAGLMANGGGAVLVRQARGDSLGMRAVVVHLSSDAVALFATMVAAVAVILTGSARADAIASVGIGLLVISASWRLLSATIHVLLEGTPAGVDVGVVEDALLEGAGVVGVHHLHVWSLASDTTALSAHVVFDRSLVLHEAQHRSQELKDMLADRFGIEHATLELECHDCDVPDDTGRVRSWRY